MSNDSTVKKKSLILSENRTLLQLLPLFISSWKLFIKKFVCQ